MVRATLCWVLAAFFAAAGVLHFTEVDAFSAIVPPMLPHPEAIVRVTGAMELLFALGLMSRTWRAHTGWALAVYLVCVLPANIYMALEGIPLADWAATKTALWLRVGLQFPLIALILWSARSLERKPYRGSLRG